MDLFSGEEIALVDKLIEKWKDKNATEISSQSHEFIGWICAEEGETIPYAMALISNRELTEEELDYADTINLSGFQVPREELIGAGC